MPPLPTTPTQAMPAADAGLDDYALREAMDAAPIFITTSTAGFADDQVARENLVEAIVEGFERSSR